MGSQESVVQAFPSSQLTGVWTQPAVGSQESVVHALPSSQLTGVWTQPAVGSQESVVQAFPSSQLTAAPPRQAPDWQVSPVVQALLSSHGVPFAFAGFEHTPVPGSHVPTAWHWSS